MVGAILGGGRSIQSSWQDAPSANGHRSAFASVRSPGYVAEMDTVTASSGFSRSIVMKAGLAPADVRAGAAGSASAVTAPALALEPTLVGTGIQLGTPDIAALPAAGTPGHIDVPVTVKDPKALPKGIEASVRWDPIQVATIVAPDPATEVGNTAAPAASAAPAAPASPAATPATDPSVPPTAPPADQRVAAPDETIDLVVPEKTGDVVAPATVTVGKKALSVPVTFPTAPGRYRLTVWLHDQDGVAYDAATQAMIPSLIVRVTGDYDGAIQAAPTADLTANAKVTLGIRVVNLGTSVWGHPATAVPSGVHFGWASDQPAYVIGRWIPLSVTAALSSDPAAQVVGAALPIGLKPGVTVDADLDLTAPPAAGDYLLLLDILTPERGSLVASGADPTLIRVSVTAAAP